MFSVNISNNIIHKISYFLNPGSYILSQSAVLVYVLSEICQDLRTFCQVYGKKNFYNTVIYLIDI